MQETLYDLVTRVMSKNAKREPEAWRKLPCRTAPWLMLIDGWEVPDVQD